MKLKVKGLFAILIFALAIAFPILADGAVISVDSITVEPGESFAVDVRMSGNTDAISALTVPLKFSNSYLQIDSVSFAGSLLPGSFRGVADIDNASDMVRVSYVPDQYTAPVPTFSDASGVIAAIHFTLQSGADPGIITIDSVNSDSVIQFGGNEIHIRVRVEFSDQSGTQVFLPDFESGDIAVQISTGIGDDDNGLLPAEFNLGQNYPNPFNPTTTIEYSLPRAGSVTLKVYNVIGQEVATLVEGNKSPGVHLVSFDGTNQPSGVYFYKLFHQDGTETKKMMMVK